MAKIERFEDVEAWQDARLLVKEVYQVTSEGRFARDFGPRDQIRRAAISTMSNIAEGFERGSDKDFVRFLYMAKASAGEVRSQLYVAFDLGYMDKQASQKFLARVQTVSRRISGFIRYLESTDGGARQGLEPSMRKTDAQP